MGLAMGHGRVGEEYVGGEKGNSRGNDDASWMNIHMIFCTSVSRHREVDWTSLDKSFCYSFIRSLVQSVGRFVCPCACVHLSSCLGSHSARLLRNVLGSLGRVSE